MPLLDPSLDEPANEVLDARAMVGASYLVKRVDYHWADRRVPKVIGEICDLALYGECVRSMDRPRGGE